MFFFGLFEHAGTVVDAEQSNTPRPHQHQTSEQSTAAQSATMETPRLLHVPLRDGEIRILTLRAGEVTDAIVCSLRVAVLDERPAYEALSYAWGDPGVTETICVDGVEVDVTVNLESALR